MAGATNDTLTPLPRTAREVQQNFAEHAGENFWDILSENQVDILVRKLYEALRYVEKPSADERCREMRESLEYKTARKYLIAANAIWKQRKYTNKLSLTSIIFVLVVTGENDVNRAEDRQSFSCHPVVRSRRCVSTPGNSSSFNCCIFVDENGRVYQNWASYVATNELPAGVMVAPAHGIYQMVHGQVKLDKYKTPSRKIRKVLGYFDLFSVYTAKKSFGCWLLPLCVPTIGPALAIFNIIYTLVDRSQHEQSLLQTEIMEIDKAFGLKPTAGDCEVDEVGTDACDYEVEGCTTVHLMVRPNNDSVDVLALEQRSVVVGGVVFVMKDYGKVLFDNIVSAKSFDKLITDMARDPFLGPDVFNFIMELTRTFLDTVVEELTSVLKFIISTESVLYRIKMIILEKYSDAAYEVITDHAFDILSAARAYYMALNPNPVTPHTKKCDVCEGYFTVCQLNQSPSEASIYKDASKLMKLYDNFLN